MDNDRIDTAACPAAEDLAAFIDNGLSPEARAHMERHLADCSECREVAADATVLSEEALPAGRWGSVRRYALVGAGTMTALAASLMLVAQLQPGLLPFGEHDPYADLVAAVGQNRTVEGRLTGGFAYAAMKPATRAALAAPEDNFALLAAKSALQERALREPTAANRHAAGLAHLVAGDHAAAVGALEAALAEEPARAAYHSDLAAAYLARGREWASHDDFGKARTSAERAISLDPSLDEAYFNQALALDALGQARDAEAAYRRALARDPQSPWNAEIVMRMERVRRP